MTKYKPYPKYKDSGVEWLGEVPEGWEILKGKRLYTQRKESAKKADIQLAASQKYGVIPQESLMETTGNKVMLAIKGTDNFRHVEKDDFVISLRSFEGGIEHSTYTGCISPAYTVLSARKKQYPNYYKLLFKSHSYIKALQTATDSLRDGKSITFDQFSAIGLPSPPLPEQTQIAAFLNHETAKIDSLIAKQEKLIELLKEKRRAVISHAVTKGMDPNAPMKDSGVEWLGEIPEGWEVKRLKHVALLQSGIAKGKNNGDRKTISVPYLRVANVQDGYIDLSEVSEIKIEPHELDRYLLKAGDVLMNEGGDNDKLGRGTVWGGDIDPCIHQNHVFAIRPHLIEPEWISLLTQSSYAKFYFFCRAKQSTNLASISASNILETPLIVPPKLDRQAVMSHVAIMTGKIDRLINVSERKIPLLQERRTALISAAVTGKIDVRDWQADEVKSVAEA
jgi:type I restriction enzyme S subunit